MIKPRSVHAYMGFVEQNQLWRQRKHHGRKNRFASGEELTQAAEDYFDWCDRNPLSRTEYVGSQLKRVELPLVRAYTITGLCVYLHLNATYWRQLRASKSISEDLQRAIHRIDAIIYTQKFEGAAAGLLNPNIISRDLGLAAKNRLALTASLEPITGMIIL